MFVNTISLAFIKQISFLANLVVKVSGCCKKKKKNPEYPFM